MGRGIAIVTGKRTAMSAFAQLGDISNNAIGMSATGEACAPAALDQGIFRDAVDEGGTIVLTEWLPVIARRQFRQRAHGITNLLVTELGGSPCRGG